MTPFIEDLYARYVMGHPQAQAASAEYRETQEDFQRARARLRACLATAEAEELQTLLDSASTLRYFEGLDGFTQGLRLGIHLLQDALAWEPEE